MNFIWKMKYSGPLRVEAAGTHTGSSILVPFGTYLKQAPLLPPYLNSAEVAPILEAQKEPMVPFYFRHSVPLKCWLLSQS